LGESHFVIIAQKTRQLYVVFSVAFQNIFQKEYKKLPPL